MGAAALPLTPGLPIVGSLLRVGRQGMIEVMMEDWKTHGDVFGIRLGKRTIVALTHPEHFRHVLKTRRDNYVKLGSYDVLRVLIGDGLVTSNGEKWAKNRRLANPAFLRGNVERLVPLMAEAAARAVERWRRRPDPHAPLDMAVEMTRLTLEVAASTLFDVDLSDESDVSQQAFGDALHRMSQRSNRVFATPLWVPSPNNLRLRRSLRLLERVLAELIAHGQSQREPAPTLIHQLLHAVDPLTGERHTAEELRDEAMTMIFAGHETMATSTMWGWNLISDRPEVFERLREESERVLGDRLPTLEDLPRLEYTKMVFDEILRLRNPVWSIGRDTLERDEIDGYPVEPGHVVMPSIYMLHRHPEFWERPEEFDPERFAPGKSERRHPFQYLPFSGGPRYCIGNNFAIAEGQVIMSVIAARCRLEMIDPSPIRPIAEITIRPHRPIWMRPTFVS
jgi:cytochrome P450